MSRGFPPSRVGKHQSSVPLIDRDVVDVPGDGELGRVYADVASIRGVSRHYGVKESTARTWLIEAGL